MLCLLPGTTMPYSLTALVHAVSPLYTLSSGSRPGFCSSGEVEGHES